MARIRRRADRRARIPNPPTLSPLGDGPRARAATTRRRIRGGRSRPRPTARTRALTDTNLPFPASAPALHRDDLVVQGAEVQARGLPGVEVVGDGDGAAGAGALPNGDVLVEGGGALDGGLVDLGVFPDGVGGAVAGEGAFLGALLGVADWVFDDVVFDQGVGGPAVLDGLVVFQLGCVGGGAYDGEEANA